MSHQNLIWLIFFGDEINVLEKKIDWNLNERKIREIFRTFHRLLRLFVSVRHGMNDSFNEEELFESSRNPNHSICWKAFERNLKRRKLFILIIWFWLWVKSPWKGMLTLFSFCLHFSKRLTCRDKLSIPFFFRIQSRSYRFILHDWILSSSPDRSLYAFFINFLLIKMGNENMGLGIVLQ